MKDKIKVGDTIEYTSLSGIKTRHIIDKIDEYGLHSEQFIFQARHKNTVKV